MHLCFVVEGYPTKEDPFMPFIRELAAEMVRQGVLVSVIAPQSVTRAISHKLQIRPIYWKDFVDEKLYIEVYQPHYISLSNKFRKLNEETMIFAAKRAFMRIKKPIDALYGHFWHMGVVASKLSQSLPIFVASGESKIEIFEDFKNNEIGTLKKHLAGVIYVGTKAYEDAKELGLQSNHPYIIAPNGYNPEQFYPMDKKKCREKLTWPLDEFIVSFVGSFNKRKGVDRLSKALSSIDDVYSCFIGSGNEQPDCRNILFCGKVAHKEICTYLNAADVFVLPTNNEGCCNAIVEALACGLPVVSSDQLFNCDILDNSCSLQIDPMNIDSIKNSIVLLKQNLSLREKLARGAEEKSINFNISVRAERIIQFVKDNLL